MGNKQHMKYRGHHCLPAGVLTERLSFKVGLRWLAGIIAVDVEFIDGHWHYLIYLMRLAPEARDKVTILSPHVG